MENSEFTRDPFSGRQLMSEDAFASLGSMEAMDGDMQAKGRPVLSGVLLAIVVTAAAIVAHRFVLKPLSVPLGGTVLAMVLGIALKNLVELPGAIQAGCRWVVACLIPVAIVALGAGLDLSILTSHGVHYLGFVIAAILVSVVASLWLGKLLKLKPSTSLLIGCGTGICGSSAILAVAPITGADEEEIIVSVGAINLIGILAMFLCIVAGATLPIGAEAFGIWTGATIHAIPTVAAAAFDHSKEAGEIATLVKLGRVAMLVPMVLVLAWTKQILPGAPAGTGPGTTLSILARGLRLVPWFVWGFAFLALAGNLGLLPGLSFPPSIFFDEGLSLNSRDLISSCGKLLLALAMAAIGLQVNLKSMLNAGTRSIVAAALVWLALMSLIFGLLWFS